LPDISQEGISEPTAEGTGGATTPPDSEIFNKFGPACFRDRCHAYYDFVSGGFLALIVGCLVLLCAILVIAFS